MSPPPGVTAPDPIPPAEDRRQNLFGPARVVDGDTLLIHGVEADLWTIDAPDLAERCETKGVGWACGEASRAYLEGLIQDRNVACRPEGPPPADGRWLGLCFVSDRPCDDQTCESDLTSLNLRQVTDGWARDMEGQYADPESVAQEGRRGMWTQHAPRNDVR